MSHAAVSLMKHFSYHSMRLQAANRPLERRTGRRGQSKLPLLVVLALCLSCPNASLAIQQ